MVKKSAALLALIFISALVLYGCSNDKDAEIVGTWIPSTALINGESVQYSELGIDESSFGITFKSNGKFSATLAGIDYSGSYVFNDTSVDVDLNGETKKLDYSGDTLSLTFDYNNNPATFTFIRQQ